MTDDEKRQQKAMLLLQYEETRQELEHLRSKAWDLAQKVREISSWLEESREMSASNAEYRQRERDAKISSNLDEYKAAFEFDTVCVLREELKSTNAKLRELAAQKKALGLGS